MFHLAFFASAIDASNFAKVGASFAGPPIVTTISGSGRAGSADGPAALATFLTPTAVAVDTHSGAIFVADSAAERIRVILPGGTVSTLAGGGDGMSGGLVVPPGFADGPAAESRFSNPSGVAVAADGSVIVADTGNRVIRRIAGGSVTTIAGRPGLSGVADGPDSSARFSRPRGLAIRRDGTIFVADGDNGIRMIASGVVTTLPISPKYSRDVRGVAVWEGPSGTSMLWYSTPQGIGRFNIAENQTDSFEGTWPDVDGLVALSDIDVAAALPRRGTLRFIELQQTHRLVAGDPSAREGSGSFADGPVDEARFCEPAGIALDAERRIVVADRCNRRIRLVPALEARTRSPDGIAAAPRVPGTYHVVYVSNSFAYWDVMWDDSIEGRLERYLNQNRERLGIAEPVRVDAVRSGAVGIKGQTELIRSILGVGSVDLVIWSVNSFMFRSTFDETVAPLPDLDSPERAEWRREIVQTQSELNAVGTKFIMFDQPFGTETGPAEVFGGKDGRSFGRPEIAKALRGSEYGYAFNLELERIVAETHVPFHPEYAKFVDFERGAHERLYFSYDFHWLPRASEFYADLVEAALEQERPWSR